MLKLAKTHPLNLNLLAITSFIGDYYIVYSTIISTNDKHNVVNHSYKSCMVVINKLNCIFDLIPPPSATVPFYDDYIAIHQGGLVCCPLDEHKLRLRSYHTYNTSTPLLFG